MVIWGEMLHCDTRSCTGFVYPVEK